MQTLSAEKEKVLRLMVWEGYAPEKYRELFIKEVKTRHQVDLKFEVHYPEEVDEMFKAIIDGKTDIISPAHSYAKAEKYQLVQRGYVLPIDPKSLTHFDNLIPALKQAEFTTHEWKRYAVPLCHGPYGLIYRKSAFDVPPNSWNALWDPKVKGKYAISSDQYEANIYITGLAMGHQAEELSDLKKIKTPQFLKKLTQLRKNAGDMWLGVDSPEMLKNFDIATSWGDSINGLRELGQEWAFAEPKEGVTGWIDSLYLGHSLKKDPLLKKIAEEYLNFCISPTFQKDLILREIGNDPVNLSIVSSLTPEEIKSHHLNEPEYFWEKRITWPELSEREQNWFMHIWRERAAKDRKL